MTNRVSEGKVVSLADVAIFLSKMSHGVTELALKGEVNKSVMRAKITEEHRMATLFSGEDFELLIAIWEKGGDV